LSRQITGTTAAEVCFMTFVKQLRDEGRLDDFDASPASVAQALGAAMRLVERAEKEAGQGKALKLGMFVSNGRVLAGSRLHSGPLHYALLEGIARCERCEIDETTSESNPLLRAHRRVRGVALSTSLTQVNGFIEVPEGACVTVGRNLEVQVSPLPA
ncbi:MAG: class II glutamine amidotransferase, partial [Myxococcales bacterium]